MIELQRSEFLMGTALVIDVVHAATVQDRIEQLLDAVIDRLRAIDHQFSTYDPDSEVSRYGRGEIDEAEVSSDLGYVLGLSESFRVATDGYFDIHEAARIGPASSIQHSAKPTSRPIEPSGVVKGWAVEDGRETFSG